MDARSGVPERGSAAASDRLRILDVSETYGGAVETLVRQFTAQQSARGLPVVATAVDGVRKTVLDGPRGAAGAVVPVGHMAALLDEVAKRLADPASCRTEGAFGRTRAEALFRPERLAARLEEAYRDAIRAHGRNAGERNTT